MAGDPVVGSAIVSRLQHRLLLGTDLLGLPAPGPEAAPARWVDGAGDVADEPDVLLRRDPPHDVEVRGGGEQGLGIRVARPLVDLMLRAVLDDLAQVHHRNAVAEVPDDPEVVGDEDEGNAEVAAQPVEQVDDLRLDRHVKGRDGLVGDDDLGLDCQCPGDPDALALTSGELGRVPVVVLRVQPHPSQEVLDALLLLALGEVVHLQRRLDDGAHRLAWVERAIGVLEDHLQLAPERPQLPLPDRRQLGALEEDRACRGPGEPDDRAAQRGLPTPGLTDQAERLPGIQVEVDTIDGLDDLASTEQAVVVLHGEVHLQVTHGEDRRRARPVRGIHIRRSSARPRPRRSRPDWTDGSGSGRGRRPSGGAAREGPCGTCRRGPGRHTGTVVRRRTPAGG